MLPVLIYDTELVARREILDFLKEYARTSGERFSILDNTESAEDAAFCIKAGNGISLTIIGVGSNADIQGVLVELERMIAEKNRDSYTLYWIKDMKKLPALAAACLHPVGFILPPPDQVQFNRILQRVMEDYASITDSKADTFLALQSGGTVYRLHVSGIDYIEALDKKLNIWSRRQCVTVYEKLSRTEELLGSRFFRCHRSYLVNYAHIESVDFAAMELRLSSGVRLPLSRSSKDRLKERISQEGLNYAG